MAIAKQPIGISFPIQLGSSGYFNQSYDVLSQVASNLSALLSTRPGERRMNPDFGSSLHQYVFEQDSDDLSTIVESAVKRDVAVWMPYVTVQSVEVDSSASQNDNNVVRVIVTYTADTLGIVKSQTIDIPITNSNP